VSDSGTYNQLTTFYAFLGSMALEHFPLGNLRVPSPDYSRENADVQHCAGLDLLRHTESISAETETPIS
jgi:hypothetical protein